MIAGGTGSGKTTLLRALVNEIPPRGADRHHRRRLRARPRSLRRPAPRPRPAAGSARRTSRATVRSPCSTSPGWPCGWTPTASIVGEVRGGEAFPMLMAMSRATTARCARCTPTRPVRCSPSSPPTCRWPRPVCRSRPSTCCSPTPCTSSCTSSWSTGCGGSTSVREIADAEGARIVSNEVFRPRSGRHHNRDSTRLTDTSAALFERHGFDARAHRRADAWGR